MGSNGVRRSLSVRDSLALLVLGCILPISAVAAYLVVDYYDREQGRLAGAAIGRTRALIAAIDHEFASIEASLLALGTSARLATGDLEGFRSRLANALRNINADAIMLTDESGHLLLSTALPYGTAVPSGDHALPVPTIIATEKSAVSDLFVSASMGGPVFAVGVPVSRGDRVDGTLNAAIRPQQLAHLLGRQQLPATWRATIVDSQGTVVARSRDMERYVGRKPDAELTRRMLAKDQDVYDGPSIDGVRVTMVYSRSPSTRWAAAIGIPLDELTAEMRHWMTRLIFACLIALLVGLLLAWFIGGRIARSVRGLAGPARQLGTGGAIELPPLYFQEAVELGNALIDAGVTLGKARHDAHHDPLTGLANRVLLDVFINQQLAVCRRYKRELSVLYIDLDGFKSVNDQHGHDHGDQLLREVSARIRKALRAADFAARLGGDEFAVCLLDTGLQGAAKTAQKLIDVIAREFSVAGIEASISASIGVAAFPASAKDADTLLKAADRAMYRAKSQGKNQVGIG